MSTIETRLERRVDADSGGITITDTVSGNTIQTALLPDERRAIAAALTADQGGHWTRDDLPSLPDVLGDVTTHERGEGAAAYRTAALAHLNDHFPKPVHPMDPARPVSPEEQGELWSRIRDELRGEYPSATDYDHRKLDLAASASADAVVEYLNDRGGLGLDTREPLERALRERDSLRCDLDWARGKCEELRSLVEGQNANVTEAQRERDAAIERVARRDGQIEQIARQRDDAHTAYEKAARERDAAVERAEIAEREVIASRQDALDAAQLEKRAAVTQEGVDSFDVPPPPVTTPRPGDNPLDDFPDDTPSGMLHVSAEDIVGVIRGRNLVTPRQVADAVMELLSGADPAVHVVRESDLPTVSRGEDEHWRDEDGKYVVWGTHTLESAKANVKIQLRHAAEFEAVARAIEAEQAVDPVEAKARELWEVARFEDGDEWSGLLQVERDCYRRMAAHVLGQEADQ